MSFKWSLPIVPKLDVLNVLPEKASSKIHLEFGSVLSLDDIRAASSLKCSRIRSVEQIPAIQDIKGVKALHLASDNQHIPRRYHYLSSLQGSTMGGSPLEHLAIEGFDLQNWPFENVRRLQGLQLERCISNDTIFWSLMPKEIYLAGLSNLSMTLPKGEENVCLSHVHERACPSPKTNAFDWRHGPNHSYFLCHSILCDP